MPVFIDMDGVKLLKLFEIKTKAPQCYYMLIKDKWDQMNQSKERKYIFICGRKLIRMNLLILAKIPHHQFEQLERQHQWLNFFN